MSSLLCCFQNDTPALMQGTVQKEKAEISYTRCGHCRLWDCTPLLSGSLLLLPLQPKATERSEQCMLARLQTCCVMLLQTDYS